MVLLEFCVSILFLVMLLYSVWTCACLVYPFTDCVTSYVLQYRCIWLMILVVVFVWLCFQHKVSLCTLTVLELILQTSLSSTQRSACSASSVLGLNECTITHWFHNAVFTVCCYNFTVSTSTLIAEPWLEGIDKDISFKAEFSKVSHILNSIKLLISMLVPIYCNKDLLWCGLNDALIYW